LEKSKNFATLLKPDPLISIRMLDRLNAIQTFKKNYNKQYSIMGWIEGPAAEAANLRTINNFCTDLLIDTDFIEDLMDICTYVEIEFAKAQIEYGADTIGIGDAVASLVSVNQYKKYIQPREKKIVKKIHEMGAYVRLHICGNITHILSGIADLGVDILDVDHMVNMADVRRIVGNKTILAGNIDPVQGVLMGKPDEIKEYIQQVYDEVGNPYMIAAGCEIPLGTPHENLKALCKSIKYNREI
jgi:MtaA/CmuA family methyltransferase